MVLRQQVEAERTVRKGVQQRGGDSQTPTLVCQHFAGARTESVLGSTAVQVPGPRRSESVRDDSLLEPSPTGNENRNHCLDRHCDTDEILAFSLVLCSLSDGSVDFGFKRVSGNQAAKVVVQPECNVKCMTVSACFRGGIVYKVFDSCKIFVSL